MIGIYEISAKLNKPDSAFFRAMTQNSKSVQTFSIEFSVASPGQNLKLQIPMWGWTRGKPKRPAELGAHAQNQAKILNSYRQ